ncbi:hypothetical protein DFH06DRAFT_1282942 [Mycena polygramma]|nr:hypothetical protein DFH06DRAFT_1282942 [Mycena polygramma]
MTWQWSGSATKSVEEMDKLSGIFKDPRFSKEDVMDFDVRRETAKFDEFLATSSDSPVRDGWKSASVKISVPDGKQHASEADAPVFDVPGLYYRPIVEVIKAAIRDVGDRCFHYTPYKQFWQPTPDAAPQRIYDEIYSSEAMVDAHTALQNQPAEPGCTLERVILALMWWSDSTHLASFGDASLWPLYLWLGNQSKWLRVKPRSNLCHHVAYFPKLPDSIHDFYVELTGKAPKPEVLTHCRRELMHAIWRLLLDDEFLEAYEHGIVIECQDGVFRRFFPRFFTYSADYPEKVLLATIRNLGKAPCPHCYLPKADIPKLGTVHDMKKREKLARTDAHVHDGTLTRIRNWIYKLGRNVTSTTFDFYLLAKSWTPTSNTFSDKLSKFGLNPFRMLVPDFMHEWELGVFKSFFIHLLRILFAHGDNAISNLNQRFRWIPTFGRSTIRRFTLNTSALKKMAAWNYQAILLCSIPVVEGLLPEPWNTEILNVLFTLAEWHTLAKLKLHTDTTIGLLGTATAGVGRLLRRFKAVMCPEFATQELPSEEAARGRRQVKKAGLGKGKGRAAAVAAAAKTTTKAKEYNLETYKFHSLGYYMPSILWFGTSDSYSTQPGELEHRRVKRFYARTNKNKAVRQMTQLERRETTAVRIAIRGQVNAQRHVAKKSSKTGASTPKKKAQPYVSFAESESLPYTTPKDHHHISPSTNLSFHLSSWLNTNRDDPAVKDFLPKLQEHLLSRLAHPDWTGDGNEFTSAQRFRLTFKNERVYRHKILRINYTSYDVRLGQDCLNPRTHSDIMYLPLDEDAPHPFAYAQIIGIFHANVLNTADGAGAKIEVMQFLWVRRYRLDPTYRGGFKRRRLHRLEFLPDSDPDAFGFINPDEVIRGAHLIPAFAHGRTTERLSSGSIGRLPRDGLKSDEDWRYYYVNFFVDRDMYMRYIGGGVGHYQVPIPPEEEVPPPPEEDDDSDEEPEVEIIEPPTTVPTPPRTPDPDSRDDRPSSALSQRSSSTDASAGSEENSDPETGARRDGLDDDGGEDDWEDEPNLGPEDGEGALEEEVEEGYAPL